MKPIFNNHSTRPLLQLTIMADDSLHVGMATAFSKLAEKTHRDAAIYHTKLAYVFMTKLPETNKEMKEHIASIIDTLESAEHNVHLVDSGTMDNNSITTYQ